MKRILAILIVAAVPFPALAQGTAMDFIRADRNPATLAAAGAGYASLSSGTAFSAFGNPALVALSEGTLDAAGVFGLAPSGDGHSTFYGGGASVRLGGFGISAGYLGGGYPEIPLSSEGGGASGKFAPRDMQAGLGLSFAIGDFLSMGALARYVTSALDSKTTLKSFSADVSALFRKDALSVSAGVIGLGPKVASVGNRSYSLPASAKLAAAYGLGFGDFSVDLMADADYYFSGNFSAAAGVQGSFKDMVFVRTGYRYAGAKGNFSAAPVPSFFSAGAGLKLYGVKLDLAAVFGSAVGSTLALSLGYAF